MRQTIGLGLGLAMLIVSAAASAKDEAPTPVSATAPAPAAEKLICKSELEVGSLVKRKKRCFTAKEWQRVTDGAQSSGQVLQDRARR